MSNCQRERPPERTETDTDIAPPGAVHSTPPQTPGNTWIYAPGAGKTTTRWLWTGTIKSIQHRLQKARLFHRLLKIEQQGIPRYDVVQHPLFVDSSIAAPLKVMSFLFVPLWMRFCGICDRTRKQWWPQLELLCPVEQYAGREQMEHRLVWKFTSLSINIHHIVLYCTEHFVFSDPKFPSAFLQHKLIDFS